MPLHIISIENAENLRFTKLNIKYLDLNFKNKYNLKFTFIQIPMIMKMFSMKIKDNNNSNL